MNKLCPINEKLLLPMIAYSMSGFTPCIRRHRLSQVKPVVLINMLCSEGNTKDDSESSTNKDKCLSFALFYLNEVFVCSPDNQGCIVTLGKNHGAQARDNATVWTPLEYWRVQTLGYNLDCDCCCGKLEAIDGLCSLQKSIRVCWLFKLLTVQNVSMYLNVYSEARL